jgi:hypothetical protein
MEHDELLDMEHDEHLNLSKTSIWGDAKDVLKTAINFVLNWHDNVSKIDSLESVKVGAEDPRIEWFLVEDIQDSSYRIYAASDQHLAARFSAIVSPEPGLILLEWKAAIDFFVVDFCVLLKGMTDTEPPDCVQLSILESLSNGNEPSMRLTYLINCDLKRFYRHLNESYELAKNALPPIIYMTFQFPGRDWIGFRFKSGPVIPLLSVVARELKENVLQIQISQSHQASGNAKEVAEYLKGWFQSWLSYNYSIKESLSTTKSDVADSPPATLPTTFEKTRSRDYPCPRPGIDNFTWDNVFDWSYRQPRKVTVDEIAELTGASKRTVERRKAQYDAQYDHQALPDELSKFV